MSGNLSTSLISTNDDYKIKNSATTDGAIIDECEEEISIDTRLAPYISIDRTSSDRLLEKEVVFKLARKEAGFAESKHDDEKNEEILGPRCLLSLSMAIIGCAFSYGWSMGVLNLPEPYIKCWILTISETNNNNHNSTEIINPINCSDALELDKNNEFSDVLKYYGLSTAALPLGGLLGALPGGILADQVGRKNAMIYNSLACLLLSLLLGSSKFLIHEVSLFLLLRFLLGISTGISCAVAPLYMNEIAPKKYKGAFGSCFNFGQTAGNLLSGVFTLSYFFGGNNSWPIASGLCAVPVVYLLIISPFCPETPAFLLKKGRIEEAMEAVKMLKGPNAKVNQNNFVDQKISNKTRKPNFIKNLKKIFSNRTLRKSSLIVISLMIPQQFCGINGILFYSGSIFAHAGLSQNLANLAAIGVAVVNCLFVLVPIFISDKVGQKKMIYPSYFLQAILLMITAFMLNYGQKHDPFYTFLSILPISIFIAVYQCGPGPLSWCQAAQAMPIEYEASVQMLVVMTNRLCCFFIGILFPIMQSYMGAFSFLPFAGICAFFTVFIYFLMVDPSGKSRQEVQKEYAQ